MSIFWRHIFAVFVFVKLIWNTTGWSATQPRGLNGTQSIHVFFQSSFWFLCFTLNTRYIYCPFAGEVKSLCWKKNSLGVTHENFFFPMRFQKWKNMQEHFFSPPLNSSIKKGTDQTWIRPHVSPQGCCINAGWRRNIIILTCITCSPHNKLCSYMNPWL